MSARDRRAAARRKVWGRGPVILRFESLEGRQLLSDATGVAASTAPSVVATTAEAGAEEATPKITLADTEGAATAISSTDASVPTARGSDELATSYATTSAVDTSAGLAPSENIRATAVTTSVATTTTAVKSKPALVAFSAPPNLDWGQRLTASGLVENQGTSTIPAGQRVDVYASATSKIDGKSIFVGTATVKEAIAPGKQGGFSAEMDAPPQPITGLGKAASFYLIPTLATDIPSTPANPVPATSPLARGVLTPRAPAAATATSSVAPAVVNDNSGTTVAKAVTVTPQTPPSLAATKFQVVPVGNTPIHWGGTIQVSAEITNQTAGTLSPPTRARVVVVPKGQSFNSPNAFTIGNLYFQPISPSTPGVRTGTVYLPSAPPSTLAGLSSVTFGLIPDADFVIDSPRTGVAIPKEGLNAVTSPIDAATTPQPANQRPNFAVVSVQPASNTLVWSKPFEVKTTIANKGTADAEQVRVRFLLVDTNHPNNAPLAIADAIVPKLQAGYQQDIVQTVNLDGKLPAGVDASQIAGRIIVQIDPEHAIDVASSANSSMVSAPVSVKLLTPTDSRDDTAAGSGAATGGATTNTGGTTTTTTGNSTANTGTSTTTTGGTTTTGDNSAATTNSSTTNNGTTATSGTTNTTTGSVTTTTSTTATTNGPSTTTTTTTPAKPIPAGSTTTNPITWGSSAVATAVTPQSFYAQQLAALRSRGWFFNQNLRGRAPKLKGPAKQLLMRLRTQMLIQQLTALRVVAPPTTQATGSNITPPAMTTTTSVASQATGTTTTTTDSDKPA